MTFERPERAEAVRRSLGQALGPGPTDALFERVARSGDPDALLSSLDRIAPALRRVKPTDPGRLHSLLAASDFLSRVLAARPGLLGTLGAGTGEKTAQTYLLEAKSHAERAHDRPALVRQLRRYKYRELLRITVRDAVDGAPIDELGRELAHLAAALIRAAFDALALELTERFGRPEGASGGLPFSALALGKLGGEDLNFSSDVDLVYVYRAEGQTDAQVPHAKLFTRLAEALTQTLSAPTADGFCYRVDLNLRPQGRAGAIALSLPAMLQYYESFGRTWERAALVKAHPVAGDDALARELLDGLRPFIWRRSVDHAVVDELREMRAQIGLRGKASAEDIKLGRGGIREIEFFVSSLQLLHGGKNAELRERRTLKALRKLEQAGLIAAPEADRLEDAYRFLRRVENRLQMLEERQAQSLPAGERERLRLARSLGFEDTRAFEAELGSHRDFVEKAFTQLLGRVAREEIPDEPLLALALDLDASREERIAALEERGFTRPEDGVAVIDRLSRARGSPFARGAAGPGLQALRWMAEIVRTPDPDQALTHFAELVAVLASPEAYLGFLERFPRAGRRLMNLFGQSDYLSRYFLSHPDLVEWLVQGDADPLKSPDRLQRELSSRVARLEEAEERLGALRRYKNEEILRIALADISGESQVPEVAAQLSAIADGVLDEALHLAQAEQRARYGEPRGAGGEAPLAVVGMGKLGGREMGYHSDLDLLFVYGGSGTDETSGGERGTLSHHEYFAKVVQRLLTFLEARLREGTLYKVDARLRPSGNQGPLVISQTALQEHHLHRGQLWERQALVKARFCAGDRSLFDWIDRQIIGPLVYERPLPGNAAQEIDRLRRRMESELSQETGDELNAKTGQGGLVDVEFTVQYLQLMHGGRLPAVRHTNTLEAIAALAAAGCATAESAEILRRGYLFLRGVENRLRLLHGFAMSRLPTSGKPLERLARRLGYRSRNAGDEFLGAYRACTAQVRQAYAQALRA